MIWFNIKELEKKLADDEVSDKEALNYFIVMAIGLAAITLFSSLMKTLYSEEPKQDNWQIALRAIIGIGIKVVGLYEVFKINYKNDNKDFFKRLFSLWVVNAIRLYVYYICALALAVSASNLIYHTIAQKAMIVNLGIAIQIIFYLMLYASFKRVSGGKAQS